MPAQFTDAEIRVILAAIIYAAREHSGRYTTDDSDAEIRDQADESVKIADQIVKAEERRTA